MIDRGDPECYLEAAMCKVAGSEAAFHNIDACIQIMGGMGFMKEPGLERILRDLRIFRIFEGTNDILRLFVSLTGLQYAGGHLKELQKALQNPTKDFGLLFGEIGKRAKRMAGVSSGPSLSDKVNSKLADSAKLADHAISDFGAAVEGLLSKYGKGIMEEQFLLHRLAEAAMDIYSMVVVLSRATRSIQHNAPTAEHEIIITRLACSQASDRIASNLSSLKSAKHLKDFEMLSKIATDVCQNQNILHQHPLGF